jgi:hypothetical protein
MKKFLASLVVLAIFVPCVSFAQTTTTYSPQYISLLQQLLTLLEQELAATQTSTSSSTPSPVPVTTTTPAADIQQLTQEENAALTDMNNQRNNSAYAFCVQEDQKPLYYAQGAAGAEQTAEIERCAALESATESKINQDRNLASFYESEILSSSSTNKNTVAAATSTPVGYTGTSYNADGSVVQYSNGKIVNTTYSNGYKSSDGWSCVPSKDSRGAPIQDCSWGG